MDIILFTIIFAAATNRTVLSVQKKLVMIIKQREDLHLPFTAFASHIIVARGRDNNRHY